jgi:hypothetical protein
MTLPATEFLRRFCQHVLPRGFVRIRNFGYLASAHRTARLALARLQLACQPRPNPPIANSQLATWRCPRCGANMHIGPNLTSQQLAFRCKCPTLPDSTAIQSLSNVCQHVFAHLRPNRKTTALSPIPARMQIAKLPLPRMPTSHTTLSRLSLPDSSLRSPTPSLAHSSIAAPTNASAFLQASLSKMPRSNFSLPQHPAPRHFRSRLTTIRPSDEKRVMRTYCVACLIWSASFTHVASRSRYPGANLPKSHASPAPGTTRRS